MLAPTLVNHGTEAGEPVVAGFGPLLPLEVATKTPALAANRKAISSGPMAKDPETNRIVDDVHAVGHSLINCCS